MLLQILVNGILMGGLYALMAIGMSLIWGVMNIINIAHGAFIMLGAFTTYWLFTIFGMDPFVSLVFSMALLFVLGYGVQRYLINYIIRASAFITLILAFGIEIFINNAALVSWTADIR
jgi:branched-chain amino acid transport system permease protein